ncbi:MAG: four helix bundle protein, partial [Salibacteraceae bacterium]
DFRKYEIWQTGMTIVSSTYTLLHSLPDSEKYGLRSQISRSAVSIPSNIAEGCSRESEKDFKRFLEYSLGSCFELETQFLICIQNQFTNTEKTNNLLLEIKKLQKQIVTLIKKLN